MRRKSGIKLKVEYAIEDMIVVTEDHGGYTAGHCRACEAGGWIVGYGYPHWSRNEDAGSKSNKIVHKKSCPMNRYLNEDATLKRKKR